MASGNHWIQQLDSQLDRAFADWNIFSTLLALALVTYLLYPIFFAPDPDTHPLLLARQAAASYVRQPGESAILRSLETPHGYPLRTGLNVKDPDAQKWMSGRDGDLRDVWKQATRGPLDADGKELGTPSKVLTVFGKEEIIELGFDKLTREINTLGNFLKAQGGFRIAIYLPSSVEFLVTLFGKI